jgi:hypothetical protein
MPEKGPLEVATRDAFMQLSRASWEERRRVLADSSASDILRGAAAMLIGGTRAVSPEDRAVALLSSWHSAPLHVRHQIIQALKYCPSPTGAAFLKEQLKDPATRWRAISSLGHFGDEDLLPVCEQYLDAEDELDRDAVLGALSTSRTPKAVSMLESALRFTPSEKTRQTAALCLARIGVQSGVPVLERQLATLQPISPEKTCAFDYFSIAMALGEMGNKCGLQALARLIQAVEHDPTIDCAWPMSYLAALKKHGEPFTFEEWKRAMEQWIEEKGQGPGHVENP